MKKSSPEKKTDEEKLQAFDEKIKDCIENKGAIEIRDAYIDKADFYKEKKNWVKFREIMGLALEKTVGASKKLEFNMDILQSFHEERNTEKFKEYLQKCKALEEEGSDWEKKNKLSLYKSLESVNMRNFKLAAEQMISTINTFSSPEILTFSKLIFYSTLLGILSLPRKVILEKLIQSSEVTTELKRNPEIAGLLNSFYRCKYNDFFPHLLKVHALVLEDEFLAKHEKYIIRQSRVVIYTQFLESYKTVTLENMANNFGVSPEFIDKELSELIASRKLNCKIDKLRGIVESQKADSRISRYDTIIKKGDLLIEKMHKLARIAQS
jgi:26S proteasome regulatory subunit N7